MGALKRTARSLLSSGGLSTLWWGRAVETAATYHLRVAMGVPIPKFPFGARCMMRTRGKKSQDDFLPKAVPAICMGPSTTVPGAFVMLREAEGDIRNLETTGNIE